MGRPLGSFTGYTPGDGGLLGDMEESWGGCFEELTQSEKLWILSYVTGSITADASSDYDPYDVNDSVNAACERLDELTFGTKLGLAQFLIANL